MTSRTDKIDVDFSLALHNRTGKYFIGRDILADHHDLIGTVRYWRVAAKHAPVDPLGLAIGKAMALETEYRVRSRFFDVHLPKIRPRARVLHTDPFTVVYHQLMEGDLVLCHDLGPVTHPELFAPDVAVLYRRAYEDVSRVGPHMVFVSCASQAAFHAHFPARYASSRVIYPHIRSEVLEGDEAAVAGITKPFLLTIGNVGARKNQLRAIAAFASAGLAQEGVQYVICGGREPGYEDVVGASDAPGIRLLGYVGDKELNWLYANASGFLLPSLLEGFGLPVAEAIARGLVPLVSRDGVLHEVAGNDALLVDPQDTESIAAGMKHLVKMGEAERKTRLLGLTASLDRFTRDAFRRSWGEVLTGPPG
ncbi:MAG: glycosyltransferase family 1 protein [Microvirga sp.]